MVIVTHTHTRFVYSKSHMCDDDDDGIFSPFAELTAYLTQGYRNKNIIHILAQKVFNTFIMFFLF